MNIKDLWIITNLNPANIRIFLSEKEAENDYGGRDLEDEEEIITLKTYLDRLELEVYDEGYADCRRKYEKSYDKDYEDGKYGVDWENINY